ncbi:MAG TPA: M50 family metallopeptidase [Kofleriaceae bacterium]|nr:M50 family metallopeptidase [Kofleriaceae bacterium]
MARARWVLLISAAVTIALYVVPYGHLIARPLMYLSTLVHELGHGLAAMLAGGSFVKLEMWSDGSGAALTGSISSWQRALTIAGGLVGPAVAAAVGFAVARRARWSRWALGAIGLLLVWAMIFKMRNGFGLMVAGIVAGAALLVAWRASADVAQLVLGFLSVQLALSVFSRGDYLFTDTAQTGAGPGPSDSAQLAQALIGPYWLWGGVCAAVSLAALAAGAWLMLRGVARQRARSASI